MLIYHIDNCPRCGQAHGKLPVQMDAAAGRQFKYYFTYRYTCPATAKVITLLAKKIAPLAEMTL